jgi:hypothetical protein
MGELLQPRCADLELAGFDTQQAAEDVWEALLRAGAFVEGNFTGNFKIRLYVCIGRGRNVSPRS